MRTLGRAGIVVLAVVVLLGATGCDKIIGSAVKTGVEQATGVKVNESNDSVTIEGKDGSKATIGGDNTLPEDFPADVPVYDGKIGSSWSNKTDAGMTYMVGIETQDAGKDVASWYESELKDGGWTIKNTMKSDDGGLFGAEKGDLKVTIAIGGAGDKTQISLAVAPKE